MEMKITSQEQKKLLSREEYLAEVKDKTTPSYAALKEEIAKKTGKPAELIVIKKIGQRYGKGEVEAKFCIYNNQESLKRFEKEGKKAAAKPAA